MIFCNDCRTGGTWNTDLPKWYATFLPTGTTPTYYCQHCGPNQFDGMEFDYTITHRTNYDHTTDTETTIDPPCDLWPQYAETLLDPAATISHIETMREKFINSHTHVSNQAKARLLCDDLEITHLKNRVKRHETTMVGRS